MLVFSQIEKANCSRGIFRRNFKGLILIFFISIKSFSQDFQITEIDTPEKAKLYSSIAGLTQDKLGNLWLATSSEGMYKYDSENFIHYLADGKDTPNTLPSNRLECIFTDKAGIIWIGTSEKGLVRFDPTNDTFISFQHENEEEQSKRSRSITSIVQDLNGILWIGTSRGLEYFDPNTETFYHDYDDSEDAHVLSDVNIKTLYLDRSGTLWAGGGSSFTAGVSPGGLYKVNTKTKTVKTYSHSDSETSLADNDVGAIFEDSQGIFWIGTAGDGLQTMNRETGEFIRYSYNSEKLSSPLKRNYSIARDGIQFITEDMGGYIWIATPGDGLYRYDKLRKKVKHYGKNETGENHFPINFLKNFYKTEDGLLWMTAFASRGDEVQLINLNFRPNHIQFTLLGKGVNSIVECGNGDIYVASENQVVKIDKKGKESTILSVPASGFIPITNIIKDEVDNLWISTFLGLYHYITKTGEYKLYDKSLGGLEFNDIYKSEEINKDSILIINSMGLYLLDLTKKVFVRYKVFSDNPRDPRLFNTSDLLVDSRKYIWVAFRKLGVHKFDISTGKYISYQNSVNLGLGRNTFFEDELGNFYVGTTGGGLFKYLPEEDYFIMLKDKTGLLNETSIIGSISSSDSHTLILLLNGSIAKYNLLENEISVYGSEWGYKMSNVIPSLHKNKSGSFYAGTNTGYVKFRPEDFSRKTDYQPLPFIEEVRLINSKETIRIDSLKDDLSVAYNQNDLRFKLAYINFATNSVDRNVYYKLDNHDKDWSKSKRNETVNYYKLDPGKYNLKIKAVDIYGDWAESSQTFRVLKPWYRTYWAYLAYFLLAMALLKLYVLYRARKLLSENKALEEKVTERTAELKASQAQLIQSEKMASLGELTAGIAHEIQNPLNFVNNFSEVNKELLAELKAEIDKGDIEEVKAIAEDLEQNEEKIKHHGQRAEGIVKGMLQHSRTSQGEKELTDINALADEYLRLAYHGLHAKDKSFNADFKTNFDPTLPKVDIVPQDIGRVLLNLINNAFFAVNQQATHHSDPEQSEGEESKGYQPLVEVGTKKHSKSIEISVKDNGPGIPEQVRDKIFQPFFTTKPTGSGTGLGLSLSYDIVKAHGGELTVISTFEEGLTNGVSTKPGTEFKLSLPI